MSLCFRNTDSEEDKDNESEGEEQEGKEAEGEETESEEAKGDETEREEAEDEEEKDDGPKIIVKEIKVSTLAYISISNIVYRLR